MTDDLHRSILDRFPTGYAYGRILRDAQGVPVDAELLEANPAFASLFGRDPSDVVRRRLSQIFPGVREASRDWIDAFARVAEKGGTEVLTRYVRPMAAWFKIVAQGGEPGTQTFTVFLSDITSSVSSFRDIDIFFDMSPDLLSIADADGRFLKVNRAWERTLGYAIDELLGMRIRDLVHPDDLAAAQAIDRPAAPQGQVERFVTRCRRKDGAYRTLDWSSQRSGGRSYSVTRDVTETWTWMNRVEYLSYHDSLTGLYNRRFLEEEIRRLDTPRSLPIAVIMGDVNRLKIVNDAFGHAKGDELIRRAAEAIRRGCRNEDLVARWGGDEFMVFLPQTTEAEAETVMARIRENCADQEVDGIRVDISFGLAVKAKPEEPIEETMRAAEDAMYRIKSKTGSLSRSELLDAITQAIHRRSPQEKGHAERVSALCARMAETLGCDDEEVQRLRLGGLLHDIGKISVNVSILEKPGALDEEEWREMRRHAETGSRLVGSAEEMVDVGNAILAHHERWDGKGYPRGIRSDEIPLEARIIAIADSYATMTSPQAYRSPMSREAAAAEILRNAGAQFDPELARLFVERIVAGGGA